MTTIPPVELDEFERLTMAAHEAPSLSIERTRNIAVLADWVDDHGGNYAFALKLINSARSLSASAAEVERLNQSVSELSDMIDGEHALNERLIREGQAKTDRIDTLRIALAKLRDEAPEPGFVSWVNQIVDEALSADDAAASGVVAESATSGDAGTSETKECPVCEAARTNQMVWSPKLCPTCKGTGRVPKGDS